MSWSKQAKPHVKSIGLYIENAYKNNNIMREENFKAPVGAAQAIPFSVFTSEAGPLTKTYNLTRSGGVEKLAAAQLYKGRVDLVEVDTAADLLVVLDRLKTHQAVGWGVPKAGSAPISTAPAIRDGSGIEGAIARTQDNFEWHDGPGVLMLDHDGGPNDGDAWGIDKVLVALYDAVPALRDAPMLVGASASASVRKDGEPVSDAGKCRVYVLVKQAGYIPRFGARLCELLWAKGLGWYGVSRDGKQLVRCLVDAAVWSPERLDFAGPVVVGEGLNVVARGWRTINNEADPLDLMPLVQKDDVLAAKVEGLRKAAKEACKAMADQRKAAWWEAKGKEVVARTGCTPEHAKRTVQAVDAGILLGDYQVRLRKLSS